jgi:hypothetical protein
MPTLSRSNAFPAVEIIDGSAYYHDRLAALRGFRVSGVYAFFERGACVYVGESHTGRLYDTITRHFRAWRVDPRTDATGRRMGGTTYDRTRVRVAFIECPAAEAIDLQWEQIQRLNPRDNTHRGTTVLEPAPF